MLTQTYHVALWDRQKTLRPADLDSMLYPRARAPQSASEIAKKVDGFFDRYEKARAGG